MRHRLRIIASDVNKQGDVLTLLTRDLFHTLGYEDCRFNVHKSGRELDVEAKHCFEDRLLVAECKATSEPIGGADINKFVGALDAERRSKKPLPVHGYFVSLSGFRETALEQERNLGGDRVTLINGPDVVQRLVDGNVVVHPELAVEMATRCAAMTSADLRVLNAELLGHANGWAWLVRFGTDFEPTHMCLVHADGRVLSEAAVSALSGLLPKLTVLHQELQPGPTGPDPNLAYYKSYLLSEYGAITLEGMPADHEVGSRSFRLESLYVPLLLQPDAVHIGAVLQDQPRIAVLGPPGAGKTTILKRLAVAYADPTRKLGLDALPDEDWLPVFLKCRHIAGGSGHKPITELIGDLVERAEMPEKRQEFVEAVTRRMRDGQVLLLVDGLDEISDTRERMAFVSQLRTFLARYPAVRVVVTSREVGFRAVAGAVASICEPHQVAELSEAGVEELVQLWHREVVGTGPDVLREAGDLARSILASDRVARLAVNPLLLTTLLLVKRWVGQLPRKRTVLYQKAVEVLLMTWNVEGHEPLNQDEALPQLAYAAFSMMEDGRAQVSAQELTSLFEEARSAIPEIFAYSKTSVNDFIQRVEERSSLLVLSGHELIDGSLQPIYEFKHLTFQEYLAALAITSGWVPADKRDDSPENMLQPHLGEESWREVVALTGVMSGRRAAGLIKLLTKTLEDEHLDRWSGGIGENLIDCLCDEITVAPELVQAALKSLVEHSRTYTTMSALSRLLDTRVAEMVREALWAPILTNRKPIGAYGQTFVHTATVDLGADVVSPNELTERMVTNLQSDRLIDQCAAAGTLMITAYRLKEDFGSAWEHLRWLQALDVTKAHLTVPARAAAKLFVAGLPEAANWIFTWALSWATPCFEDDEELSAQVLNRALANLLASDDPSTDHMSAWLVRNLVKTPRWQEHVNKEEVFPKLKTKWHSTCRYLSNDDGREGQLHALGSVVLRLGGPWSATAMIDMIKVSLRHRVSDPNSLRELVEELGVIDVDEFLLGLRVPEPDLIASLE